MKIKIITQVLLQMILIASLASCNEQLKESKQLAIEVKKRKIGRIEPFKIVEETKRLSKLIIFEADSLTVKNDSIYFQRYYNSFVQFRDYSKSDISITMVDKSNIQFKQLSTKENLLFEAIEQNNSTHTIIEPEIQKIGDTMMVAIVPIHKEKFNISNHQLYWYLRIRKKIIVENIWLNR